MELIKKHYEKILLGGVLLVLVVSAALLPVMIGSERDSLQAKSDEIIKLPAKPLEPLNLSTQQLVLQRIQAGLSLDLATTHKVFNPLFWQKTPDGRLVKIATGDETGPQALTVAKSTPLHLTITLDSINPGEGTNTTRYVIGVEREAATEVSKRRKKQYYATVDNKNDAFVLRKVIGPPENPDSLVLELTDGGEVILKKGEPFKRVDGYMVDLKYDLEKKTWNNQRVGSKDLRFGNEDYIIVAITKNEIVVLAKSNQKKTPIPIP